MEKQKCVCVCVCVCVSKISTVNFLIKFFSQHKIYHTALSSNKENGKGTFCWTTPKATISNL